MNNPIVKPGSTPPVANQPVLQTIDVSLGDEALITYAFAAKTELALYSYPDDAIHLFTAQALYDLVFNKTNLTWGFETKAAGTFTVQLQMVPLETTAPTTYPTFSVVVK
jgi:hypothetical protein